MVSSATYLTIRDTSNFTSKIWLVCFPVNLLISFPKRSYGYLQIEIKVEFVPVLRSHNFIVLS